MRTSILCLFAFLLMTGPAIARRDGSRDARPAQHSSNIVKNRIERIIDAPSHPSPIPFHPEGTLNSSITKVLLGSSRNIYGGLLSFQSCLSYNKELNDIMFTARGNDKGTVATFGTGNDILTYTSVNGGESFVRRMAFTNGGEPRYPSGVIYNPAGNTDTANAYKLVVGPLNVNDVWARTYLNSGKYDGTAQNLVQIPTDNTYQELMRNGLTATSDNKFHFSGLGTVLDAGQTAVMSARMYTLTGTWNTGDNRVDWNSSVEVEPMVVQKPSTGSIYIDGSYTQEAWAKDGSVGYLITIGADDRPADKPSYIPMVWKSENAGDSWTMLPYFDWGTLSAIRDNILPTRYDTTVYKPFFEEASIVLDANNKPHIFGLVRGGWSANLDSLSYVFIRASTGTILDGNIVELYLDENDTWHGNWIDSISADAVSDAESPYYSTPTNVGWDHRVSASVNEDGTKVFCTWTDSDWIFWGTEPYDLNPDLKSWGRDIITNYSTEVKNFTANTDLWGLAFYNFTCRSTMTTNPGTYELPVTITDIYSSGLQADEPVYHYYVKGCSYADEEFVVGINDKEAQAPIVGKGCYPNPVNGETHVDLTLPNPAPVSIEIFSITGVKVASTNYGTLQSGTHTLTINASGLHSGVWFYTVTAGDKRITQKMVVS